MKSTVPVGTGRGGHGRPRGPGRERTSPTPPTRSSCARAPPSRTSCEPDRVVIGCFRDEDGAAVEALYRGIDTDVVRTSVPTAEMIKYASNAFLATKISFINEIANVCEQVGADVRTVARGMGLDHRIGPHFLQAGIGYGGSLLPQGRAGAQAAGRQHRATTSSCSTPSSRSTRCRSAAWSASSSDAWADCAAQTVALLGLTFKPNTDDLREAASIVLAGRLIHEGAQVRGLRSHDRRRRAPAVPRRGDLRGAAGGARRRRRRRAGHGVARVRPSRPGGRGRAR